MKSKNIKKTKKKAVKKVCNFCGNFVERIIIDNGAYCEVCAKEFKDEN